MAGDTVITVVGNLTGDPELRFTPNGAAVANFTIASTPLNFEKASGEWKEGETLFLRASIWREAAENVAETLHKGMRVIAQGRLKSRTYETKEGERRASMELEIEEIGPSLRFASATVNRNQRNNNGEWQGNGGFNNNQGGNGYNSGGNGYNNVGSQGGNNQGTGQNNNSQQGNGNNFAPPADNSWGAQSGGNYNWGGGSDDEPPF